MDIPAQGRRDPVVMEESDPRALVGSPDNMSSLPEDFFPFTVASSPPNHPRVYSCPSRPPRVRSMTSPPVISTVKDQHSVRAARNDRDTSSRSSGVAGLSTVDRRREVDHEWTVFGELMGTSESDGTQRSQWPHLSNHSSLLPGIGEGSPNEREGTLHAAESLSDLPEDEPDLPQMHGTHDQHQGLHSKSSWIPSLPACQVGSCFSTPRRFPAAALPR